VRGLRTQNRLLLIPACPAQFSIRAVLQWNASLARLLWRADKDRLTYLKPSLSLILCDSFWAHQLRQAEW
jgi:hypothetical protein